MDYTRQQDLVDSEIFSTPITVIGGGGIGSFTTLALAKMGFNQIQVYDDDKVEEHNLPNQFYRIEDVGVTKVGALQDIVKKFTSICIYPKEQLWDKYIRIVTPIVISAVDTMKVRTELYKALNASECVLIDGRMGGHQLEVRTCDMRGLGDKIKYKGTLWKDSETSPLPCTQKAVMYNVLVIAGLIANQVRLVLSNKPYNREMIYDFETGTYLNSGEIYTTVAR